MEEERGDLRAKQAVVGPLLKPILAVRLVMEIPAATVITRQQELLEEGAALDKVGKEPLPEEGKGCTFLNLLAVLPLDGLLAAEGNQAQPHRLLMGAVAMVAGAQVEEPRVRAPQTRAEEAVDKAIVIAEIQGLEAQVVLES